MDRIIGTGQEIAHSHRWIKWICVFKKYIFRSFVLDVGNATKYHNLITMDYSTLVYSLVLIVPAAIIGKKLIIEARRVNSLVSLDISYAMFDTDALFLS